MLGAIKQNKYNYILPRKLFLYLDGLFLEVLLLDVNLVFLSKVAVPV